MPKRPQDPANAEAQLLAEISTKLDRLIAVLAAQGKEKTTQIEILSAAGCDSIFIGKVVGMTPGSVRKQRSRVRANYGFEDVNNTIPEAAPHD